MIVLSLSFERGGGKVLAFTLYQYHLVGIDETIFPSIFG